jgi:6-phosphogluconolactonase (cycloisomerase 2 family)
MDAMKLKLSFALLLTALVALSGLSAFAAAGAVYTLNNSSSGNAVLVFSRSADGQISSAGIFSTGGSGTGKGLGNQGALAIDAANRFLFAVNAGSDNISVFRIGENGLHLVDLVPSGGKQPISLTVSRRVLYVLNNGGAVGGNDTIAGFGVGENGRLKPIISGLPLSAASVGPAQIGFNTDGNLLLVTEKTTNNIDLFSVDDDGVAVGPTVISSAGQTPFGFAFGKRNEVFVSDAFGGAANAGALSSYAVSDEGPLRTISGVANDNQTAPCWVVLTSDGRFVYTTNTGSGTISGYAVAFSGALHLLNANGQTANTGSGSTPLDAALSNDGRFLYVLTPGTSNIQGFVISLDGSLTPLSQATGIPSSASGLVAR